MRLITPRLQIRLPDVGEGWRLADYYRLNQEFLQPYYPKFSREDFDPRAWESTIPHVRAEFDARRSMRLCLYHLGELCGVVNITGVVGTPRHAATLGYSLNLKSQGQGLMREALSEIIPFALERFNLHRLEANYMPRNERSGRTLSSLGFHKEGLAIQYLLINDVWEDHVLTALLNPEAPHRFDQQ